MRRQARVLAKHVQDHPDVIHSLMVVTISGYVVDRKARTRSRAGSESSRATALAEAEVFVLEAREYY